MRFIKKIRENLVVCAEINNGSVEGGTDFPFNRGRFISRKKHWLGSHCLFCLPKNLVAVACKQAASVHISFLFVFY
jgi:hypothetical protein